MSKYKWRCDKCGALNTNDDEVCEKCGGKDGEEMIYCNTCQTYVPCNGIDYREEFEMCWVCYAKAWRALFDTVEDHGSKAAKDLYRKILWKLGL